MKKFVLIALTLITITVAALMATPPSTLFSLAIQTERQMAGLTPGSVNIPNHQIHYLQGGQGPDLVLLHGFGADKDNWTRMAAELTPYFQVTSIDLPGFGESSKRNNELYDLQSQLIRLEQIFAALKLDNFCIAGNSMGGYLAGNYAAEHPEQTSCLWLLNPLGVASASPSEMFQHIAQGKRPDVLASNLDEYHELIEFVFQHKPFLPDLIVEQLATRAAADYPLHKRIFQEIHEIQDGAPQFSRPLETGLIDYPAPVFVLWGQNDRVLHHSGARVLKQAIPSAYVEDLPDMGHLPMMENPLLSATLFHDFYQNKVALK